MKLKIFIKLNLLLYIFFYPLYYFWNHLEDFTNISNNGIHRKTWWMLESHSFRYLLYSVIFDRWILLRVIFICSKNVFLYIYECQPKILLQSHTDHCPAGNSGKLPEIRHIVHVITRPHSSNLCYNGEITIQFKEYISDSSNYIMVRYFFHE